MSYEQQFYLKRNEEKVKNESYIGDDIFFTCGQRDVERLFARAGTRKGDSYIVFNLAQASSLLSALSNEMASLLACFAKVDEEFYEMISKEEITADRLALNSYAILYSMKNSVDDIRFDLPFYSNFNTDDPISLLCRYTQAIGRFVKEMDESDELILHIT